MEPEHPLATAYTRYGPQLRRYIGSRGSDPAAVDDLLQATFLEAWKTWHRYEDRGFPLSAWLYAIAKSRIGDHGRQQRRRLAHERTLEPIVASDLDVCALATQRDETARLWAAIAALPERQRAVVELRFREELPAAVVAQRLGMTEAAVKAMQYRAMRTLEQRLGPPAL